MKEENANKFFEIKVTLAGRQYPVMVNHDEEAIVLDIAKRLNQEIDDMQAKYGARLNKQDILAMLLFTREKQMHDIKNKLYNFDYLHQRLDELDELLDTALYNKSEG